MRDVTYHNLDTCLNWQSLIENRISRHVWLKTYLTRSHKLTNPKLISKNCRIKACFDTQVYDLLSFKAISLFFNVCTVWIHTLSQGIAEQNQLGSHIIIHWRSYALGFARKLKRLPCWRLGHPNPYHTLLHSGNIPCLNNTLVGNVRYHITSLKYTLPCYSVELYPALIHCSGKLNLNTLLGYTQTQQIAELYPILLHCWVIPNFNALISYTEC